MNEFFESLAKRWKNAAERRGAKIEEPKLDEKVAAEILELARVAAHTQERRFAPLASFMAGVAVERLRAASGSSGTSGTSGAAKASERPLSASELADFVREVRQQLEREPPL